MIVTWLIVKDRMLLLPASMLPPGVCMGVTSNRDSEDGWMVSSVCSFDLHTQVLVVMKCTSNPCYVKSRPGASGSGGQESTCGPINQYTPWIL